VFAPTNDAFENLPEGTVARLLKPESKKKLTTVLTYHVVDESNGVIHVIDTVILPK
jgi:uncharacterized surface protein with fasciclin (FAS1) repeats